MDPTILLQKQIRENASEMQSYFSDLSSWEKKIKEKDGKIRKKHAKTLDKTNTNPKPVRQSNGTTSIRSSPNTTSTQHPLNMSTKKSDNNNNTNSLKQPHSHLYDKGYKKWENFDVEAELAAMDQENTQKVETIIKEEEVTQKEKKNISFMKEEEESDSPTTTKNREEIEKDQGNEFYLQGDFIAAIKCYTRCLGYNNENILALSNRAMCYIKTKEFKKAHEDCTLALKYDPSHLKSLNRRGVCRNALGRHQEALIDFEKALCLQPNNRQTQSELRKTREFIKTTLKRAPQQNIVVQEIIKPSQQPEPSPTSSSLLQKKEVEEKKENKKEMEKNTSLIDQSMITSQKAPKTSYEFCRVWKSFISGSRKLNDVFLLKAHYLKNIQLEKLDQIFKNSMEEDIFMDISKVIMHECTKTNPNDCVLSTSFIYDLMIQLSNIPRFHLIIQFLNATQKQIFQDIFKHLKKEKSIDQDFFSLQKKYGITL